MHAAICWPVLVTCLQAFLTLAVLLHALLLHCGTGLLHSAVNPTCGDVEYIAIFNTASVVTEKAVPALLKMPQASGGPQVLCPRRCRGAAWGTSPCCGFSAPGCKQAAGRSALALQRSSHVAPLLPSQAQNISIWAASVLSWMPTPALPLERFMPWGATARSCAPTTPPLPPPQTAAAAAPTALLPRCPTHQLLWRTSMAATGC